MAHRDDIASDLAGVIYGTDEYAEPVTYTPAAGDAISTSLLPLEGASELYNHLQTDQLEWAVKIPRADVSSVKVRQDTITQADGTVWRVVAHDALNSWEWVLGLVKEQ